MNSYTTPSALIAALKTSDQDHEFYPTTNEIILALVRDVKSKQHDHGRHDRGLDSVLDIGAGNGKVLKALKADAGFTALHAIEKSSILCAELDAEVMVVGTDFHEQSLLSKQVDVIFCNPPYSQFEGWAEKIIRQAPSQRVYLVIPQRWENSTVIADAVKFRSAGVRTIGAFDFEDAEDRKARAKVHLLRITLPDQKDDAFERFFNEQFADLINKFEPKTKAATEDEAEEEKGGGRNRPFHSLVLGPNYPEALVNLYRQEMANVERNYQLVGQLDVELLREFEIYPSKVMAILKTRLSGLRNDYWAELFSRLDAVTARLTSKSRASLLGTLQKHVQVDFTVPNIYEVVIWVIKNSNRYIDSQLISTYEVMIEKCNVQKYVSNKKVWVEDKWRYGLPDGASHYALDYRIVTHRLGGVGSSSYSWESGLVESGADFLGDLLTIARNLGFNCETSDDRLSRDGRRHWNPGSLEEFYFAGKDGKRTLLFDVRGFKNGNVHLRLNQKFMLALNVEHGRLKGWLRTAQEAAEELKDPEAVQYFKTNAQMLGNSSTTLLLGPAPVPVVPAATNKNTTQFQFAL